VLLKSAGPVAIATFATIVNPALNCLHGRCKEKLLQAFGCKTKNRKINDEKGGDKQEKQES